MDEALRARQVAAAKDQAIFREVNERIATIATAVEEEIGFVCECFEIACNAHVYLSGQEYEEVRESGSDRFFVLPGHDRPEVESVVRDHRRYVVVQKIEAGADVAAFLDPRIRSR